MKNLTRIEAEKRVLEAEKYKDIPLTNRNDKGSLICITDIQMKQIPSTDNFEVICIYHTNSDSCPETGLTGNLEEILIAHIVT